MHSAVGKVVTENCYARAGLIGNPSDGYGGKTLAVSVKNFSATVTLTESQQLCIEPDQFQFASVNALQSHVRDHGYYGAARLFKATLNVFSDYVAAYKNQSNLSPNFTVSYQTTIPRMVGLAGSSALVVAMLKALMRFYSVSIDKRVLPSLALAVERSELNIGGGLQDRVVQFYQGVVAMDFAELDTVDGYACGRYEPIATNLLPPLYLAYSQADSEPTEVFHNDLRSRFESGDKVVVDAMRAFANYSERAVQALMESDPEKFSSLMDQNFDLRNSISTLNTHHVAMIEAARSCGVSAKYAGSGGAIVGVCSDEATFVKLKSKLETLGCVLVRPIIE